MGDGIEADLLDQAQERSGRLAVQYELECAMKGMDAQKLNSLLKQAKAAKVDQTVLVDAGARLSALESELWKKRDELWGRKKTPKVEISLVPAPAPGPTPAPPKVE